MYDEYGIKIWEQSLNDFIDLLGSGWFDLNEDNKNTSMCQKFEEQVEHRHNLEDFDLVYIKDSNRLDGNCGLYFFKKSNKVYWKFTYNFLTDTSEFIKKLYREINIKLFNNGIGCLRGPENESELEHGWICPKCGRVNAPSVRSCPCSDAHSDFKNPNIPLIYPYKKPSYPPTVIGPFVDNPYISEPSVPMKPLYENERRIYCNGSLNTKES